MQIYQLGTTPQCHASTIVETPAGLVAAWFGGTQEGHPDVGIWLAKCYNAGWSTPFEVVKGNQGPPGSYPCWNPVLFYPDGGPLMLFYKVGPSPPGWWGMLITSPDFGITWSAPRRLGEDDGIGHLIGPVKNKPVQLEDGSILCPSSTEQNGLWRVHFERTGDQGDTWEVIGPINSGEDFAAIQPSILNYPDGRMQILCRSQQQIIVQSWSDDGRTWGKLRPTSLPNPNSGTDAVTLKDGRQVLVYNNSPRDRTPLNIAVSQDGQHWQDVLTLEHQQGEYSYPAVIQSGDGKIHIAYTYLRKTIKHVVLEPGSLDLPT